MSSQQNADQNTGNLSSKNNNNTNTSDNGNNNKLQHAINQILANPRAKHLLANLQLRQLPSVPKQQQHLLIFLLETYEYIFELDKPEILQEVWTYQGSITAEKQAISEIIDNCKSPFEWCFVQEYKENKEGTLVSNDITDLYFQLKYVSLLCEQSFQYDSLLEVHKALLFIIPMKENIDNLYSSMKLSIKGLLSSVNWLQAKHDKLYKTNPEQALNNEKLDIKSFRRDSYNDGMMAKKLYNKYKFEEWTAILEGAPLKQSNRGYEMLITSPSGKTRIDLEFPVHYAIWSETGVDKFLKDLELQLKPIAQNNIQQLIQKYKDENALQQITAVKFEIDSIEKKYESKIRMDYQTHKYIHKLLDSIQGNNQYTFLLKHLQDSIKRFSSIFSSGISDNKCTIVLDKFSKIRCLLSSDDEYYLITNLEDEYIRKLNKFKNLHPRIVNQGKQYELILKYGIFARIEDHLELEIREWLLQLDLKLASADISLIVLEFHCNRYLGGITVPKTLQQISVKECLAYESKGDQSYLAEVKKLESDDQNKFDIDLTKDNMSLEDAKIFVLTDMIHSCNDLFEYNPKDLDFLLNKLQYLSTIGIFDQTIQKAIESKTELFKHLRSVLDRLKSENQKLLAEVNTILLDQSQPTANLYVIQIATLRLEKQLVEWIGFYGSKLIQSFVKAIVDAKRINEYVTAVKMDCGEITSCPFPPTLMVKQEVVDGITCEFKGSEAVSLNNSSHPQSWRELEQMLLEQLGYQPDSQEQLELDSDSSESSQKSNDSSNNNVNNSNNNEQKSSSTKKNHKKKRKLLESKPRKQKSRKLVKDKDYTNNSKLRADSELNYYIPLSSKKSQEVFRIVIPFSKQEILDYLNRPNL